MTSYSAHYLEGIDLFNGGHFWHAHEAWETAWNSEQDLQRRLFYKGIIQTTAALVHWQRGNPKGLHRNWEKARPKLAALPMTMLGLDLPLLIETMDRFVAADGVEQPPPQLAVRAD